MANVTLSTQLTGFGFDWTTANLATILQRPLTVATSTDLQWSGSSPHTTWAGDVFGTGMVPVLTAGKLTDVTAGTITSLDSHSTINGLTTEISITNIADDAAQFFDFIFARNWKGVFNYIMRGADHVSGTTNSDSINGGLGADQLLGNGGNDKLGGGAGADHLFGGLGNDTLIGGFGHDVLTGGLGADQFVYNQIVKDADSDHITDFLHGVDHIALSHVAITGLGALGTLDASHFHTSGVQTASQVILYDALTGWVSYDADASGAGAAVHLVQLAANTALAATDFLVI